MCVDFAHYFPPPEVGPVFSTFLDFGPKQKVAQNCIPPKGPIFFPLAEIRSTTVRRWPAAPRSMIDGWLPPSLPYLYRNPDHNDLSAWCPSPSPLYAGRPQDRSPSPQRAGGHLGLTGSGFNHKAMHFFCYPEVEYIGPLNFRTPDLPRVPCPQPPIGENVQLMVHSACVSNFPRHQLCNFFARFSH